MGGGSYCSDSKILRNATSYTNMSIGDTFAHAHTASHNINHFKTIEVTNAKGEKFSGKIRESRDSKEHPESLAVLVGLDVTGSMGYIPHSLIKDGLPTLMKLVMEEGEKDPQLLMMAIGDHTCDRSSLQPSQFESSDELVDKALEALHLEGGGGGNDGESYLLAWYFATFHTITDCFEKRGRKGVIVTIGDEKCLPEVSGEALKSITGNGDLKTFSAVELLSLAQEKYDVYHVHVKQGYQGQRQANIDHWRELLGDNLLLAESADDIPAAVASAIKLKDNIGEHREVTGGQSEVIL